MMQGCDYYGVGNEANQEKEQWQQTSGFRETEIKQ